MNTDFPESVLRAMERSIFAETPFADWAPLFAGGMLVQIPAGISIGDTEEQLRVMLVVSGTFRMFYTDESGKQLTVRYITPGEIMGLVAAVGGPFPLEVEPLEDAEGWLVTGEQITRVASQNATLAWVIAQECAHRLAGVFAELTTVAFGSIRDRLIRHLLKLAETRYPPEPGSHSPGDAKATVIRVSQQELADAVGTSREVIARSLRELRDRELLGEKSDRPGTIVIPDLSRLHRELASALSDATRL
ncbi:MAG: Crp/Fnr family transcriptional regulator [bacterium]|nr:Crp/Fnr family transcriptional regulator [bacterium]